MQLIVKPTTHVARQTLRSTASKRLCFRLMALACPGNAHEDMRVFSKVFITKPSQRGSSNLCSVAISRAVSQLSC